MKIKNNNVLIFERKKITGTTIAGLAGLDKFNPPGDTILSMLGYQPEPFDQFYSKRGEIAESLALRSLTKRNHQCVVYDKFKCHFDNFPDNSDFGGLIDIEIPSENTLYEIKSKNIKDYDNIVKFGNQVQELQAMHYGWLRGYKTVHIMWIFFDDQSESEIKSGKPLSTLKSLKMFEKSLDIDIDYQNKIHQDALNYYNSILKSGSIPISDISEKMLNYIKGE